VSCSVDAIKRHWENMMAYPAGKKSIKEIIRIIMAMGWIKMLLTAMFEKCVNALFGFSSINCDNNCLQYMDCPVTLIQNKIVNTREKRDISNGIINLLLMILQKYIRAMINGMVDR
jgi:hypothetical protein